MRPSRTPATWTMISSYYLNLSGDKMAEEIILFSTWRFLQHQYSKFRTPPMANMNSYHVYFFQILKKWREMKTTYSPRGARLSGRRCGYCCKCLCGGGGGLTDMKLCVKITSKTDIYHKATLKNRNHRRRRKISSF
jgi:hypothetical protein